jgi:hypothetical protein
MGIREGWPNFEVGDDSGVPTNMGAWRDQHLLRYKPCINRIARNNSPEDEMVITEASLVTSSWTMAYAELYGCLRNFAEDKDLTHTDRIAALEVLRKTLWDMSHNPAWSEERAEDGEQRVA